MSDTVEVLSGSFFYDPDQVIQSVPLQAVRDFAAAIGLDSIEGIAEMHIYPRSIDIILWAETASGNRYVGRSAGQPKLLGGAAQYVVTLPIEP